MGDGKNRIRQGILLSYLSMGFSVVISLLYTPFLIKCLGQQQYGLYNIADSVIGYLSLFKFGLGTAVVRYSSKLRTENRENEIRSVYGLFITIYSVLAVAVLIVGGLVILYAEKIFNISTGAEGYLQLRLILAIMIVNLVVSFPASVYQSIITSYERFAFLKGVSIAVTVVTPAVMIPLLMVGHKAVMLTAVVQIIHIIASLIYVLFVHLKLRIKVHFNFKILEKSILKEIFTYSGFIFLGLIVDQLYWNTDKVILSVMIGEIPVAIYAVASQIHSYYQQFSGSISEVFFPRVTRMVAEKQDADALSALFIKIGRMQAHVMLLVLFGFVAFGQEFIGFWAGDGYEQAYWIALLVVAPATVPLIESTGFLIIKAMNKHKFRSILYLIIALANVALSIPACVYFGAIGCALCTCVCVIVGHGFIMNWFYWKKIRLAIPTFWAQIARMALVGAPLSAAALMLNKVMPSQSFLVFAIKIVVFTAVYFLCQYAITMNTYEKGLISKVVKKVLKQS